MWEALLPLPDPPPTHRGPKEPCQNAHSPCSGCRASHTRHRCLGEFSVKAPLFVYLELGSAGAGISSVPAPTACVHTLLRVTGTFESQWCVGLT